ncbi:unnamed protein product [Lota lota]
MPSIRKSQVPSDRLSSLLEDVEGTKCSTQAGGPQLDAWLQVARGPHHHWLSIWAPSQQVLSSSWLRRTQTEHDAEEEAPGN